MKVWGFTEIQDSLGSHLGVPYFCKALVVGLYPTQKSLPSGNSSTFDKHFGTIFKDGCSSDAPIIATFKRIQGPSWWLQKGWQFDDTWITNLLEAKLTWLRDQNRSVLPSFYMDNIELIQIARLPFYLIVGALYPILTKLQIQNGSKHGLQRGSRRWRALPCHDMHLQAFYSRWEVDDGTSLLPVYIP